MLKISFTVGTIRKYKISNFYRLFRRGRIRWKTGWSAPENCLFKMHGKTISISLEIENVR